MSARRLLAVVALAASLAGGCGLGDKQTLARRVEAAADATAARASIGGTLRAEIQIVQVPFDKAPPTGADAPVPATFTFGTESAARGASLDLPTGPVTLFEDNRVWLRRPDAAPKDARPWLMLDYAKLATGATPFDPLDYRAGAAFAAASVLDPRFVLDIVASPLTGSVEDLGPSSVDGQPVERYRANVDIDKALEDRRRASYSDERRSAMRDVLGLLAIDRTVNPAEFWVGDGGLRRVRLVLRVNPNRYSQSDLVLTLDLGGPAPAMQVPERSQVVVVDSLSALARSAGVLAVRGA